MIAAALDLDSKLFTKCGFKKNKQTNDWPKKVEHVADSLCLFEYAKTQSEVKSLARVIDSLEPEEPEGFQ